MATRRPSNPAAGSALPAPSPTARRQSFGRASVVGALPIGSTRKSSAASLTGAATGAAAASDSSNVVVAPTSARRAVNRRSSIISDAVSKIIMPTRFPGRVVDLDRAVLLGGGYDLSPDPSALANLARPGIDRLSVLLVGPDVSQAGLFGQGWCRVGTGTAGAGQAPGANSFAGARRPSIGGSGGGADGAGASFSDADDSISIAAALAAAATSGASAPVGLEPCLYFVPSAAAHRARVAALQSVGGSSLPMNPSAFPDSASSASSGSLSGVATAAAAAAGTGSLVRGAAAHGVDLRVDGACNASAADLFQYAGRALVRRSVLAWAPSSLVLIGNILEDVPPTPPAAAPASAHAGGAAGAGTGAVSGSSPAARKSFSGGSLPGLPPDAAATAASAGSSSVIDGIHAPLLGVLPLALAEAQRAMRRRVRAVKSAIAMRQLAQMSQQQQQQQQQQRGLQQEAQPDGADGSATPAAASGSSGSFAIAGSGESKVSVSEVKSALAKYAAGEDDGSDDDDDDAVLSEAAALTAPEDERFDTFIEVLEVYDGKVFDLLEVSKAEVRPRLEGASFAAPATRVIAQSAADLSDLVALAPARLNSAANSGVIVTLSLSVPPCLASVSAAAVLANNAWAGPSEADLALRMQPVTSQMLDIKIVLLPGWKQMQRGPTGITGGGSSTAPTAFGSAAAGPSYQMDPAAHSNVAISTLLTVLEALGKANISAAGAATSSSISSSTSTSSSATRHINYRDSVVTKLLKGRLGEGNSSCVIGLCLPPAPPLPVVDTTPAASPSASAGAGAGPGSAASSASPTAVAAAAGALSAARDSVAREAAAMMRLAGRLRACATGGLRPGAGIPTAKAYVAPGADPAASTAAAAAAAPSGSAAAAVWSPAAAAASSSSTSSTSGVLPVDVSSTSAGGPAAPVPAPAFGSTSATGRTSIVGIAPNAGGPRRSFSGTAGGIPVGSATALTSAAFAAPATSTAAPAGAAGAAGPASPQNTGNRRGSLVGSPSASGGSGVVVGGGGGGGTGGAPTTANMKQQLLQQQQQIHTLAREKADLQRQVSLLEGWQRRAARRLELMVQLMDKVRSLKRENKTVRHEADEWAEKCSELVHMMRGAQQRVENPLQQHTKSMASVLVTLQQAADEQRSQGSLSVSPGPYGALAAGGAAGRQYADDDGNAVGDIDSDAGEENDDADMDAETALAAVWARANAGGPGSGAGAGSASRGGAGVGAGPRRYSNGAPLMLESSPRLSSERAPRLSHTDIEALSNVDEAVTSHPAFPSHPVAVLAAHMRRAPVAPAAGQALTFAAAGTGDVDRDGVEPSPFAYDDDAADDDDASGMLHDPTASSNSPPAGAGASTAGAAASIPRVAPIAPSSSPLSASSAPSSGSSSSGLVLHGPSSGAVVVPAHGRPAAELDHLLGEDDNKDLLSLLHE